MRPRDIPSPSHLATSLSASYIRMMNTFFFIVIGLAMLATLIVLGMGIVSMIKGGDPRRSNKLMQSRVMLQGLALLLFALFMLLTRK